VVKQSVGRLAIAAATTASKESCVPEAAIELDAVTKSFGPKIAVHPLALTIPTGSLIGFIGPNGAGKTTTIRMIMSILFPDSGGIRVLGKSSAVESKDRIGYLPEERGIYKKMRVGKFIAYIARLKGLPNTLASGKKLDHVVRDWLTRVDLADCYAKRCEELSKGMQQKVQFVASIIHEPDLIILDEPFSGLDPVNSRLLRDLIDEQHKAGRTIIFSTHQMSQAEALCDRVVMIHQGRKVLDDTPAQIRSRFDPRSIDVEPATPSFDGAAALRAVPEVDRVDQIRGGLRAHLRETVTDASAIVPKLAAAMPVRRIEVVQPTLEDIFVDIVQGAGLSTEKRDTLLASLRGKGDTSGD
jgi:ABC-2 type transport system ATP-binding protein